MEPEAKAKQVEAASEKPSAISPAQELEILMPDFETFTLKLIKKGEVAETRTYKVWPLVLGKMKLAVELAGAKLDDEEKLGKIISQIIDEPDTAYIKATVTVRKLKELVGILGRLNSAGMPLDLDKKKLPPVSAS